jgi:hypothetical protein
MESVMAKKEFSKVMTTIIMFTAASAGLHPAVAQSVPYAFDDATKRTLVRNAVGLLDTMYVFRDLGDKGERRISDSMAAGDYASITDPVAFAARLTSDLQSVTNDKHLQVHFNKDAELSAELTPTNGGFIRVDRLQGNIGYIKLRDFPPGEMFSLFADEAMRKLQDTKALIIDLRENIGGDVASVSYFSSFFFDPTRSVHLDDLIYRVGFTKEYSTSAVPTPYLHKPIYILTSRETFSGGEEFTNDMKVNMRATVVGEVTAGGANSGISVPLNDFFLLYVPVSSIQNAVTKSNWEGVGVAPDLPTSADLAFKAAALKIVEQLTAKDESNDRKLIILKAKLQSEADVDHFVDEPMMPVRSAAQRGGEAALRTSIDELVRGVFNMGQMSPNWVAVNSQFLNGNLPILAKLGAMQSVSFNGVDQFGADVYNVQFENGLTKWRIFILPDGKIANLDFLKIE